MTDWMDYIVQLSGLMGLEGWRISLGDNLDPDGDESDTIARVVCTYGQRHALMRLARGFDDLAPERQRMVLVHELVHCHLDRIRTTCRNFFHRMGAEAQLIIEDQLSDDCEYATDALARAWAERLPLPFDTDSSTP